MAILLSWMIKSIIASGVLYGYYLLALRNKKLHGYNRFYLVGTLIVSLAVPFFSFSWFTVGESAHAPLARIVTLVNPPVTARPDESALSGWLPAVFVILISACLLIVLALKIRAVYRLKRAHTAIPMQGFTLIETESRQAPFSFFSNLFWKRGLPATDANGERIFRHELAHIRQKHSYDKLFVQLICCIGWMNPFYWLIQKELDTVHEFIADASAVDDGDTGSFAAMLLYAHNDGSYLSPVHPFFHSSIKRRLVMISLSNKPRYSYLRRLLVLPVALLVLGMLSLVVVKASARTGAGLPVSQVAMDTVPKAAPAPKKQPEILEDRKPGQKISAEPVKVTGKKLNQQPPAAPEKVEDRKTIPGVKLQPVTGEPVKVVDKKTVPGVKLQPVKGEPVKVVDKKIVPGVKLQPVTGEPVKEVDLESVTVTGKKLVQPHVVIKPVTGTSKKLEEKLEVVKREVILKPKVVTGRKPEKKP